MNILNLLTKEKRVAGIEISDSVIRIAFFRLRKKAPTDDETKKTINVPEEDLILIEEPISVNIIENGVVANVELLGKALKNIWEKAKLNSDYAIVSIPDDKVYSRIFSFPKSISGARLAEAMDLAISFQLPIKIEDAYLDWERVQSASIMNEIFLSTIPRTVVQGYIAALELAGIKTLAMESHLASIARSIKINPKETTLFFKKTPDGATIFALEDGVLRFSRTLPSRIIPDEQIPFEANKVKMALEAQPPSEVGKKRKLVEQVFHIATIREDYLKYPSISEPQSDWFISLGAAIRGRIPEGEDNLISLLPVGTEEAYAYQKATTFISLIRNMTIGVSVFFIVTFLGAYLFIFSLSQNRSGGSSTLSAGAIPAELLEKQARIDYINSLTGVGSSLLAKTPRWSVVLDELLSRVTEGITVTNFSAPSITDKFSLTGTAHDRATLNLFKKSLQGSSMFTEVDIPITNIEQRELIPFAVSFRLTDPGALFYK